MWTEAIWICCSLSVYPLYYIYIDRLTSVERFNRNLLWILLPAIVVAVCSLTLPSQIADTMRKILFTIEVTAVCCLGLQRLRSFDIQLKDVYADTDKMDTSSIRVLLICFVFTSVCSAVFNIIGRKGTQIEIVGELEYKPDNSATVYHLVFSGFGTWDAKNQRISYVSGKFAGMASGVYYSEGSCETDVSVPAWSVCNLLENYEAPSVVFGSWSMRYDAAATKKISR